MLKLAPQKIEYLENFYSPANEKTYLKSYDIDDQESVNKALECIRSFWLPEAPHGATSYWTVVSSRQWAGIGGRARRRRLFQWYALCHLVEGRPLK